LPTHQIKYIDFGIATLLSREVQQVANFRTMEGSLAYISPEQTGRMNRFLDYRTDFYSFGVTLYHFFTHHLPFDSENPVDAMHMHMAKPATPPC
jgi:serine/threonine protein kinase